MTRKSSLKLKRTKKIKRIREAKLAGLWILSSKKKRKTP